MSDQSWKIIARASLVLYIHNYSCERTYPDFFFLIVHVVYVIFFNFAALHCGWDDLGWGKNRNLPNSPNPQFPISLSPLVIP